MKCTEIFESLRFGIERQFLITISDIDEMALPKRYTLRDQLKVFSEIIGQAVFEMLCEKYKDQLEITSAETGPQS